MSRWGPRPCSAIERLSWIDRVVARFEIAIASIALAVGLAVSLYTVAMRSLVFATEEWVLELPMELLVVAAIYGSGALISRDEHLAVSFVFEKFPARARRIVAGIFQFVLALFGMLLAERALTGADQAARAGLSIPELFDLPLSVPLRIASVGFGLWSFHFWVFFLKATTRATTSD